MDDILVASETAEQHISTLREVFELLVANRLELRIDKCAFLQTEVEFIGYLVSEKGISPTKEGVKSVQRIPIPRNIKEVHSFVALCSYFRKFISSFSLIAKPLYKLLRKNVSFKFGAEELHAVEVLKDKLTNAPVLAIYNRIARRNSIATQALQGSKRYWCNGEAMNNFTQFFSFQSEPPTSRVATTASSWRCWRSYTLYDASESIYRALSLKS
jgi:hypothetical protein